MILIVALEHLYFNQYTRTFTTTFHSEASVYNVQMSMKLHVYALHAQECGTAEGIVDSVTNYHVTQSVTLDTH